MWYLLIPLGWALIRRYQGKSILPDFMAARLGPSPQAQALQYEAPKIVHQAGAQLQYAIKTYQSAVNALHGLQAAASTNLAMVDPGLIAQGQSQLAAMKKQILARALVEGVAIQI